MDTPAALKQNIKLPRPSRRWTEYSLLACAALALVALLYHSYAGTFARLSSDDYYFHISVREKGVIGSSLEYWRSWYGRWSAQLLTDLSVLAGPGAVRFLPAFLLASLVGSAAFALREATRAPWRASMVFGAIVTAFLMYLPATHPSLHARSASLGYIVPMIVTGLLIGYIARQWRKALNRYHIAGIAAVGFIVPGFSEMVGLVLLLALSVALVASLCSRQRNLSILLFTAILGGVAGLLFVLSAPGNAIRVSHFPPRPAIEWTAQNSWQTTSRFIGGELFLDGISGAALAAKGLLILSALVALVWHPRTERPMQLAALVGIALVSVALGSLLTFAAFALPWHLTSQAPPLRVEIIAAYVLTVGFAVAGYALGVALQRLRLPASARPLAAALTALVALWAGYDTLAPAKDYARQTIKPMQQAAAIWDYRDAELRAARAAGKQDVEAPIILTHHRGEDIAASPENWVNQGVAKFYGLDSVRGYRSRRDIIARR